MARLIGGIGQARHGQCQVAERNGEGGNAAAVDAARRARQVEAGHRLQQAEHPLLDGMVPADVTGDRAVEVPGQSEEAGMLARAVVVPGVGGLARSRHRPGRRLVGGIVAAAFQVVDRAADAPQPAGHQLDMARLAAVAGRGQRDLLVAEPEARRGTGLDQRQRLQWLDRRARIDRLLEIAAVDRDPPGDLGHGDRHLVPALDVAAAGHLDDHVLDDGSAAPAGRCRPGSG